MMNAAQVDLVRLLAHLAVAGFLAGMEADLEAQTERHVEAEDGPDAEAA